MNKQNKILLGLLAFVVACTIGYALFSETITINGTATAKGEWQLTTTCMPGIDEDVITAGFANSQNEGQMGYKNDTCTVVGNEVTYAAELEYPTAGRLFTMKIKNTGTIPAQLSLENGINVSKYVQDTYDIKTNELVSSNTAFPGQNGVTQDQLNELIGYSGYGYGIVAYKTSDNQIVQSGDENF